MYLHYYAVHIHNYTGMRFLFSGMKVSITSEQRFPCAGLVGNSGPEYSVYAAPEEGSATAALERFSDRWDKKYPKISQSWRDNWANLSAYFKYPAELRRLIYTTNTIEGFNRQLRKVTKAKSVFPTDDSLLKMLYLAMMDITKKWTGRRQDWSIIHAQMAVYFEDRLPK